MFWCDFLCTYIYWFVDIPCVRLLLLVFEMIYATITLFCFMMCECESEDFIGVWKDSYLLLRLLDLSLFWCYNLRMKDVELKCISSCMSELWTETIQG